MFWASAFRFISKGSWVLCHSLFPACKDDIAVWMRAVRTTSLTTNFNGSHFDLLPSSIHRMTGWVAIYRTLRRMRTAPICGLISSGEAEVCSPHTRPTTKDDYSAPGLWEKAHLNRLDFLFWNIRRIITRRATTNRHTQQDCFTPNWVYVFPLPKASGISEKLNEPLKKRKFRLTTLSLISKYRGTESSETKILL